MNETTYQKLATEIAKTIKNTDPTPVALAAEFAKLHAQAGGSKDSVIQLFLEFYSILADGQYLSEK